MKLTVIVLHTLFNIINMISYFDNLEPLMWLFFFHRHFP